MANNLRSLVIYIVGALIGLVLVTIFNILVPIPFELRIVLIIFLFYLLPRFYKAFKEGGYTSKLQSFKSLNFNQKMLIVIVVFILIVLTYIFIIKPQVDKMEFTQCIESSNKSLSAVNTCSLKVFGRPGVNITY